MIAHITTKKNWNNAKDIGEYKPESLKDDGFIHCSNIDQIIKIANQNFKDRENLVLLLINENQLNSEVVYEDLYESGEKYPHIYGPLNTDAVQKVYDFKPDSNGEFMLPEDILY